MDTPSQPLSRINTGWSTHLHSPLETKQNSLEEEITNLKAEIDKIFLKNGEDQQNQK